MRLGVALLRSASQGAGPLQSPSPAATPNPVPPERKGNFSLSCLNFEGSLPNLWRGSSKWGFWGGWGWSQHPLSPGVCWDKGPSPLLWILDPNIGTCNRGAGEPIPSLLSVDHLADYSRCLSFRD